MEISQMLKAKRKEHNLTQEQLSEKIFVSKKTISNWETRKTTPDIDSLIRLAHLFDLSLDNLLLEGSDIVENLKKNLELKEIKQVVLASVIASISIVIVVIFGKLSLPFTFLLVCIAACNALIAFYLDAQLNKVKKKNRN